jgi:predicted GNAT family acetyltransferase
MPRADLSVANDVTASRFTLHLDGELVSRAHYTIDGTVVTVPHVETDPAHRGHGFAAVLMDGVIESLRADGLTIRPICSYAASYLDERPETHDLVAR